MTAQERRNKAHINEARKESWHFRRGPGKFQLPPADEVSITPKVDRRADRCRLVVVVRCPHCGFIDPQNELNKPERYTRAERRVFTRCDNCCREFEIRDVDITDAQHELLVALGEA